MYLSCCCALAGTKTCEKCDIRKAWEDGQRMWSDPGTWTAPPFINPEPHVPYTPTEDTAPQKKFHYKGREYRYIDGKLFGEIDGIPPWADEETHDNETV